MADMEKQCMRCSQEITPAVTIYKPICKDCEDKDKEQLLKDAISRFERLDLHDGDFLVVWIPKETKPRDVQSTTDRLRTFVGGSKYSGIKILVHPEGLKIKGYEGRPSLEKWLTELSNALESAEMNDTHLINITDELRKQLVEDARFYATVFSGM